MQANGCLFELLLLLLKDEVKLGDEEGEVKYLEAIKELLD